MDTRHNKNKLASTLGVYSLLLLLFFCLHLIKDTTQINISAFTVQKSEGETLKGLKDKIVVPEIIIGTSTISDYSRLDFDAEVKLDIGRSVKLRSQEGLDSIEVPPRIRSLIELYDSNRNRFDANLLAFPFARQKERAHLDATFKYLIQKELIAEGLLPQDYFEKQKRKEIHTPENIVDLSGKKIKKHIISKSSDTGVQKVIEPTITFEKIQKKENEKKGLFTSLKEALFSYIHIAIAWAQGIPPAEQAKNYLVAHQNTDGSWGTNSTKFISTIQTLETLHMLGMGTSTAATTSAAWINFSITDNNDYLAQKIKALALAQEDTTDLADYLINNLDEETGGISFDRGFEADPLTTAHAIEALFATAYQDAGENPSMSISAMIYFLANTQRFDGGWSTRTTNTSSIITTADVLTALLPYGAQTVTGGGAPVIVGEVISKAVSFLKNKQNTNGSWNNTLVASSRALTALKKAGATPLYSNEALAYLESTQRTDGSWENGNIYVTATALEALVWGNSNAGDIVINDITSTSTLATGQSATIQVSVTNVGGQSVSQGIIHVFTDTVHAFEFNIAQLGVTFLPNETILFNITFPNTYTLVGDVTFTLFFESGRDVAYTNGWYEEMLHFNSSPAGLSGLPLYFQASQGVFSNGSPSIIFNWPEKTDPNRLRYEAMWRPVGQTSWNVATVSSTGYIVAGVFAENTTYEVTLSTISNGQNRTYFTNPTLITTSSTYDVYDGSVSGTLSNEGIPLSGVRVYAGNFATTNESGNFSRNNINNGSHIARVDQDEYDTFITPFSVLPNQTTSNVKVYTRLSADTEAPIIDGFSLIARSPDGIIRNKKEHILAVGGYDNVALDFASFYYYNPADSLWHFIATEPIDTNVSYYWYIPENFVGSGYKVKATLTDYRGNVSNESIFGPFTIVAGNKEPSLEFIEPNGTADISDNQFVIKWTDSDPDDNAIISLYYDDDTNPNNGGLTPIATLNEDDPLNQYIWNTSALLDGSQYVLRAVISDGHILNGSMTVYSKPIVIDHTPVTGTGLNTHSVDLRASNEKFFRLYDNEQNNLDIIGDLTIEAWYKPAGSTAGQALVSKWTEGGGQRGYSFRMAQSHPTEKIRFAVSQNGANATEASWNKTLAIGVWYHLAVVYNANAGTAELFVNGQSEGIVTGILNSIKDNTSAFRVGAISGGGGEGEFLDGSLDEVRVWNRKRTAQEITNNKDTHILTNEPNLMGYWRFNGTPQDFSQNINDLTPLPSNNLPPYITDVPFIASGETIPTISITEPNGVGDTIDSSYVITWNASDPDDDAHINLYYDTNASGLDGTLIASNLSENTTTSYIWNTTNITEGNYYIYGRIGDGTATTTAYSAGAVSIDHNGVPSITIIEPNGTNDNANQNFNITWNASDPDNDAQIAVYYDTNNFGYDGTLIVSGLLENTATSTLWNTAQILAKKYYIYATISDGINPVQKTYGTYPVRVNHGGK
jgi:hypothetical protein